MNRQNRRRLGGHIRAGAAPDGTRTITLRPVTPGVVDDYGSLWMPDVFDRSLDERLPTLAWAHLWSEPIGRATAWAADGDLRTITFRLDDPAAVPTAGRAYAQVQSGTIDDCSVGFSNTQRRDPTDDEVKQYPGIREVILEADLDEVSLVLRGAVPGAKVLAVRARGLSVDADLVIELARRVEAGDITQAQAEIALDLAAEEAGDPPDPEHDGDGCDPDDVADAEAALDDALALIERSR